MRGALVPALYLISAVLFILGLKGMTRVRSARRGNLISAVGMLLAVAGTLLEMGAFDWRWIVGGAAVGGLIGAVAAFKVAMTAMPEMVALFNGAGGGASMLVALAVFWAAIVEPGGAGSADAQLGPAVALTGFLSIWVGGVTLSGSVLAFGKLAGWARGRPAWLKARNAVNVTFAVACAGLGVWLAWIADAPPEIELAALLLAAVSLVAGVLLVLPIGGADMPVVISLLNSFSGVAAAMTGFVLANNLLIIAGSLVGASGLILTEVMCRAMNRTLWNVLFTDFGDTATGAGGGEYGAVRSIGAEEGAMLLEAAERVVIVPGYGLAVSQAQHAARELADLLADTGTEVTYAIHPVAGRMPGHMNVLLAEADVPYEQLVEMDRANPEFKRADVVIVVGANDVVNPAAETTPGSPVYGMPVLKVWEARTVIVIKRSLGAGYAGIKNELFERDNTMMIFSDAKRALQDLAAELKQLTAAA